MFEYCLWSRDSYITECEGSIPEFEAQWAQAIEDIGCKVQKNGRCKRLNNESTFVNLRGESESFDKYWLAKKHFKVAQPNLSAIYDFDNLDGSLSSEVCGAYIDLYEDAEVTLI